MRVRIPVLLFLMFFLMISVAACGGGGQSDSGSQEGNSSGDASRGDARAQQKAWEEAQQGGSTLKSSTVKGTLGGVKVDKNRFALRPAGGGEPMRFRINPDNLEVTSNGNAASPQDLKDRQKVEVRYVEKNGKNLAQAVQIEGG